MRLQYLLTQAIANLRRNPLVVFSAVVAVFVMLMLVFSATLVRWSIDKDIGRWDDNVRVIAFLTDDLPTDQVAALQAEVTGWEEVDEVIYYSKADALEEFRGLFEDDEVLLDVVEEDPSVLPPSLRVKPVEAGGYSAIVDRMVAMPGVLEVSAAEEAIDALVARSNSMRTFAVTVSFVLGAAAVILIANTIRMAIYARRDEIGIMKLVGAGNWFVRIPFLLEGLVEGIAGAVLAATVVWIFHPSIVQMLSTFSDSGALDVPTLYLVQQSLWVLIFGAGTGLLGSVFGMWGFLRD